MTWKELEKRLLLTIEDGCGKDKTLFNARDVRHLVVAAAIAHDKAKRGAK